VEGVSDTFLKNLCMRAKYETESDDHFFQNNNNTCARSLSIVLSHTDHIPPVRRWSYLGEVLSTEIYPQRGGLARGEAVQGRALET
jgi:hypothetical protein